jgi:hypothetical protein
LTQQEDEEEEEGDEDLLEDQLVDLEDLGPALKQMKKRQENQEVLTKRQVSKTISISKAKKYNYSLAKSEMWDCKHSRVKQVILVCPLNWPKKLLSFMLLCLRYPWSLLTSVSIYFIVINCVTA